MQRNGDGAWGTCRARLELTVRDHRGTGTQKPGQWKRERAPLSLAPALRRQPEKGNERATKGQRKGNERATKGHYKAVELICLYLPLRRQARGR
ncbi:MAG: hypothetical protein H7252_03490 [Cytophaga sp.]|nr:hypothetical protein [Undibacterium sp.]